MADLEAAEDDKSGNTAAALAVIEPAPSPATLVVPAMIADLGEAAALRFIDFFTANIRNSNTRTAYAVAVRGFFRWLEHAASASSAASAPTTCRPTSKCWPGATRHRR